MRDPKRSVHFSFHAGCPYHPRHWKPDNAASRKFFLGSPFLIEGIEADASSNIAAVHVRSLTPAGLSWLPESRMDVKWFWWRREGERIVSRSESDNNSIRIQGAWDSRVQAGRKNHPKKIKS
jgi:hypothetical protein